MIFLGAKRPMKRLDRQTPKEFKSFNTAERFGFFGWAHEHYGDIRSTWQPQSMMTSAAVAGGRWTGGNLDDAVEWMKKLLGMKIVSSTGPGFLGLLRKLPAQNYSEQILQDSPVYYHRLDSLAPDNSPNLGTAIGAGDHIDLNGVTTGVPGLLFSDVPNLAWQYDGVNDRAYTVSSSTPPNATEAASVEAWFTTGGGAGANQTVVEIQDATTASATGRSLEVQVRGNVDNGQAGAFRNQSVIKSGGPDLRDSQVHHIIGTAPANGGVAPYPCSIWVDGVFQATTPGNITFAGSRTNHQFNSGAHRPSTASGFFNGVIDEIAMYDYELSAGQVTAHYNAGKFGIYT